MDLASILTRLDDLEDDLATCLTTTAPSMPLSCTATLNGGGLSATITFSTPVSDGGSPITGYTVVATPGGANVSGGTSPLVVTGINGNVNGYTFEVRALNAVGHSVPCVTNGIGQFVGPVASAPLTPAAAIKPGSPLSANVTFTTPVSNGGNPILFYSATSSPGGLVGSSTSSPVCVAGLTGGTTYTFTVRAYTVNGAGIASAASNSVTPQAPLTNPNSPGGGLAALPAAWVSNVGRSHDGYVFHPYPGGQLSFASNSSRAYNGAGRWVTTLSSAVESLAWSDDDFETWTYVAGSGALTGIPIGNQNVGYGMGRWLVGCAASGSSTLAKSDDNGVTFTAVTTFPGAVNYCRGLATDGAGGWVALCDNASGFQFAWSTDNGDTWTGVSPGGGEHISIAYGNGVYIATRATSAISRSTNSGATWTTVAGAGTTSIDVAYGGGVWVVVGSTGTTITSSHDDGQSWGNYAATFVLSRVTYHSGQGVFRASNGSLTFMTSTDGSNWLTPVNETITGLADATPKTLLPNPTPANVRFVACGVGASPTAHTIITSQNGFMWGVATTNPFSIEAFGVAHNAITGVWIAGGEGGNSLARSTDGRTWTGLGLTVFSTRGRGLAHNGAGRWIATGQGTNTLAYSDDDGLTWTGLGTTVFSTAGYAVAYDPTTTTWIAVGEGTNSMARSTNNGVTWVGQGTGTFTTRGAGVAVGRSYAYFGERTSPMWIAVGEGGNTLAQSIDGGLTWIGTGVTVFATRGASIATDGADTWVAMGEGTSQAHRQSNNGFEWFTTSGVGVIGRCVAYDGENFVALPDSNLFKISRPAGTGYTWVNPSTSLNTKANAVASSRPLTSGVPVARFAGVSSAVNKSVFSEDGIRWPIVEGYESSSAALPAARVAYSGYAWMSTASRMSYDGLHWFAISIPVTPIRDIKHGNDRWVAISDTQLAWSDNGLVWTLAAMPESRNIDNVGTPTVHNFTRVEYGDGRWLIVQTLSFFASGNTYSPLLESTDNAETWRVLVDGCNAQKGGNMAFSSAYGCFLHYEGDRFVAGGDATAGSFAGVALVHASDGHKWSITSNRTLTNGYVYSHDVKFHQGRWYVLNATAPAKEIGPVAVSDDLDTFVMVGPRRNISTMATGFVDVHTGLDTLVCGGDQLAMASSQNGILWNVRPSTYSTVVPISQVRAAQTVTASTPPILRSIMVTGASVVALSTTNGTTFTAGTTIPVGSYVAFDPATGRGVALAFNQFYQSDRGTGFKFLARSQLFSPGTCSSVAFGNGRFIAGFNPAGATPLAWSLSGYRWTAAGSGVIGLVNGVAYNSISGRWLAVGSTTNNLAYSDDQAVTWTGVSDVVTFTGTIRDAVYATALSLWVVVGTGVNSIAHSSNNGLTWTGQGVATLTTGVTIAYHAGRLVAGGTGASPLVYSDNGTLWSSVTYAAGSAALTAVDDVIWTGTMWLATQSLASSPLAYSYNGATWYSYVPAAMGNIRHLVSNQGLVTNTVEPVETRMFAVTTTSSSLNATNNGRTWQASQFGTVSVNVFDLVYVSGIGYVGVHEAANSHRFSPDGVRWHTTTGVTYTATASFRSRIATNGSAFVSVHPTTAQTHKLAFSSNGTTWTGLGNTLFTNCRGIAFGGGLWVAVGFGVNTVATSPDGTTWTGQGVTLFGASGADAIAYNPDLGRFILVGVQGAAYSDNGLTWTVMPTAERNGKVIAYGNGVWVLGGTSAAGQSRIMVSRDNGVTWGEQPRFYTNDGPVTSTSSVAATSAAYSAVLGRWFINWSTITPYWFVSDDDAATFTHPGSSELSTQVERFIAVA